MRGVYLMGALTALEAAGLRDAFDLVVGSSAGAINGAYLLTEQAFSAVDIYVECLSNRKFVNPALVMRIVDIDYMVDEVLKKALPLRLDVLRESPTRLEVVLTDADTAETEVITNYDTRYDFYEVIRATAALPALYNRRIRIGDRCYVDGGIIDAVPVLQAVEAGADVVLAVLTRSPGFRTGSSSPVYRWLARCLARGQSPAIKGLMGRENRLLNATMDLLESKSVHQGPLEGWSVWPSDAKKLVGRTTVSRAKLRDCADMGRRDMETLLCQPHPE